ncbi:MAG: PfkB family carbohydrate kinase [Candidatus Saccharicenans sp.]|nr:PfkB family carbohydrate kinase [Candidatus Saccharicenans sp.]MDH7494211.1 PfkB family carbohydrate kinase [Candidatus Saccharicenans sp.]
MSLIIIGSVAFDTIETPSGRRDRIIGGSATYAALAASFFTRPGLVSLVGQDFPRRFLQQLRARGVDLAGLKIKKGKTFYWHGRYGHDPNQRTTIKTELNVLREFRPVLPPDYRRAEIVFLSNLDPESHDFILDQLPAVRLVAMDTIRFWIENKPEALLQAIHRVDILFVNDEECRLIARELNLVRAGRKLRAAGPKIIVVKKGEHGAMLFGQNFVFGVVANPCEQVVDPTGAGDAFAGAFLGYLDSTGRFNQRELRKAAVYGNLVASLVIEDFGVEGLLRADQLDLIKRYRSFRKLVSF